MIDAIWNAKFAKVENPKRYAVEQNQMVEVHPERSSGAATPAYTSLKETRQQKWRRLHPEKYRESQRKLMARRRAKQ